MEKKHCKRKSYVSNTVVLGGEDKETRRTSRCGIVLAIIAIIAGVLTIIYNYIKKFSKIIVLENKLLIIWCYLFMICMLSLIILIVVEGLVYAFKDIKRYNVKDEKYKNYDDISDEFYNYLIFDLRGVVASSIASLVLFWLFYAIYIPKMTDKILYFAIFGIATLVILVYIISKRKTLITKGKFIGLFIIKFMVIFVIVGSIIPSARQSKIIINFDMNKVIIENESENEYDNMQICIYNNKNEEIVSHTVDEYELLLAEDVNSQVLDEIEGEISYSPRNSLYWTYEYNIEKLDLKPGKYNIVIDVQQGNTKLHFENEFIYNKKQTKYAKKEFIKTYK